MFKGGRLATKNNLNKSGKARAYVLYFFLVVIFLFLFLAVIDPSVLSKTTGKISLDSVGITYNEGEEIGGLLEFYLYGGEFVPADSLVVVKLDDQSREFSLSNLLTATPSQGEFYAQDSDLEGKGDGFGVLGEKKVYPEVNFEVLITPKKNGNSDDSATPTPPDSSPDVSVSDGTDVVAEESQEDNSQTSTDSDVSSSSSVDASPDTSASSTPDSDAASVSDADSTSTSDSSSDSSSSDSSSDSSSSDSSSVSIVSISPSATGATVSEGSYVLSGKASKGSDFSYDFDNLGDAEIIPGSVSMDGSKIDDSSVSLSLRGNKIIVSTDYSQIENGFGADYITNKRELVANIDLSKFELIAKESVKTISIYLYYNGQIIAQTEKKISVVKSEEIPTLNATNATGTNQTNATQVNIGVKKTQNVARLGQPVKWTQKVDLKEKEAQKVVVSLPEYAENVGVVEVVKVKKEGSGENAQEVRVDSRNEKDSVEVIDETPSQPSAGSVSLSPAAQDSSASDSTAQDSSDSTGLTGQVVAKLKLDKESTLLTNIVSWVREVLSKPTGFAVSNTIGFAVSEKVVNDNTVEVVENTGKEVVQEVVVEYETPAPYAVENVLEDSKEVTIVGPDAVHYENVVSFTEIPKSFAVTNPNKIKIYWKNTNSYVIPTSVSDSDGDGLVDYAEWITPSLSNQTFIIEIVGAEHLDSNRTFISNIYDQVIALDGNWSETIPTNDYVRVTFENNLTSENDITVYPRTVSGTPRIEVYEKDDSILLAEFSSLVDNSYNKIYLTNLTNPQDTFDLRILDGDVEFDHIIDPSFNISVSGNYTAILNVSVENNFSHLNTNPSTSPFDGLVLYTPFDANVSSTNIYDYSSQGNDGTIDRLSVSSNAYYNLSGVYGGAYLFDGTGDGINIGDIASVSGFNSTSNFGASVWFKINDSSTTRYLVGDFKLTPSVVGWAIVFDSSSKRVAILVRNGASQSSCSFSTYVTDNNWHFFAGSYNTTTPTCRLDGSVTVGSVYAGADFSNSVGVAIGSPNSASTSGSWNGSLDEVMVFNKTLSSSESSSIYQNQSTRFYSRGEQFFENLNVSSSLSNENTINITVSSLLYYSDVNLKVSLGDSISGGYSYGSEYSFTNGVASNIPVNTPNNVSMKIIFYSDSANSFSTPILIGNISLESLNAPLTCRPLNVQGQTYVFGGDISIGSSCFNVTAEDIVVDGAGHLLNFSGSLELGAYYGFDARGIKNLTVKNLRTSGFSKAIYMTPSTSSTKGGNLTLVNSTLGSVEVNGGSGGPLGHGGSIYLYNSTATSLSVKAGSTILSGQDGGSGGLVYIESPFIYINSTSINLDYDPGSLGGARGSSGNLVLNFTQGFNDLNTNYNNNLSLTIVNRTVGEVKWVNEIYSAGLSNISSYYNSLLNKTYVDGTSLSKLNAHANITFYNMPGTFAEPTILKNGGSCSDCYNFTSLNAGTVRFNVSGFSTYEVGETQGILNINSCTVLNNANSVYNVTGNIDSGDISIPCLNVTAQNVTIEGNNFLVGSSSLTSGVVYSNQQYTTVRNINVSKSTGLSSGGAIILESANYSNVSSVEFSGNSGVVIQNVYHSNFINNSYYISDRGIQSSGSSFGNNTFASSIFSNSNYGVIIAGNGSVIMNNAFNNHVVSAVYTGGGNNRFTNLTISGNQGTAFDLSDGINNSLQNVVVSNTDPAQNDINFGTSNNTHIIDSVLLNYTFTGTGGVVRVVDSGVGEVQFLGAINASGNNFSRDIYLSSNLVSVRSDLNFGLNRSANVTFYNMPANFTEPYVLRNGIVCDSSSCPNYTSLNTATVVFGVPGFTNYSVGDIPICTTLPTCTEGSDCIIDRDCKLNSGLCTDNLCQFANMTFNANIYTGNNATGDAYSLDLNISGQVLFSSNKGIVFSGRDNNPLGGSTEDGGDAGTINITMTPTGLFNRTNSYFDGRGGDANDVPGDGGILQLNYHGLVGSTSSWSIDVTKGSTGGGVGAADGAIVYNKYLAPCPRDADVNDDGTIVLADIFVITGRYNNASTDSGFNSYYDVNCDDKLNVIELARMGFEFGRGS